MLGHVSNVCFLGEVGVRQPLGDDERRAAVALGCPDADPLLVAVDGLGIVLGAAAPGPDGAPVAVVEADEGGRGLEDQLLAALWVVRHGTTAG